MEYYLKIGNIRLCNIISPLLSLRAEWLHRYLYILVYSEIHIISPPIPSKLPCPWVFNT